MAEIMKVFKRLAVLMILVFSLSSIAFAQDRYLMTGAARFEKTKDAHALPIPVNPIDSSVLTPSDGVVTLRYGGHECSVKIQRQMNFYFDPVIAHAFGSIDAFETFLSDKFHMDRKPMNEIYLLGDANMPLCSGLRFATIYKSADDLVLASGAWMYAFQRETHPPMNAERSFDCSKARTTVERLVCADPDLVKLDEMVNRGFVAMQLVESKEISYQDPVRKDQINWIRNVRNKCVNSPCLTEAYRARVQYIKGRISSAYPSYPEKESGRDGGCAMGENSASFPTWAGARRPCGERCLFAVHHHPTEATASRPHPFVHLHAKQCPGQSLSSTLSRRLARR
ncbi:lysozyme inhibitor LprI family protein [Burkholderia ubonensis]|uniref:lysozyme inhibitor LprI family protein n=1 Tax=Burkholderia ubonensis TaxID=101571 RepID=UPI0018DF2561|nr:hypothetical protein [Burkholderia ubonensis]